MAPSLDDLNAFANREPPKEPIGSRTFMWPKVSYAAGVADVYPVERRYMSVFGEPLRHWLHTVQLIADHQDLIDATRQPLILRGCWFLSWYMRDVAHHSNDDMSRYGLYQMMQSQLTAMINAREALYDGKVVVDAANNPPDLVDAGKIRVDLYLKPTKIPLTIHIPLESGTQAELDAKWDAWAKRRNPA